MNQWAVYQDGKVIHHGMTRSDAERHAAFLARGYESRRASDKRRVAEFDVKPDSQLNRELDENWKQLKKES